MENEVAVLAREAGIVGAGGAGFPTHVKLSARVEYVIVNGAECEPLMTVDQVLMLRCPSELAAMLEQVRLSVEAGKAVVAVKKKHAEAVASMRRACSAYPEQRVHELGDFYPAGDEVVLVYEVTGRLIPHGGIPLDCGVVVLNVETLYNLHKASQGHPLTDKWVTMAGEVRRPGTYCVPLGVSVSEMLALAGGAKLSQFSVINGGPMMGKLVGSLDEPVIKTTKGLLVLPDTSLAVVNRLRPITTVLRQAQSLCCQCRACVDLCPRGLLGYEIRPNRTILAASYGFQAGKGGIIEALLCSECGVCDLYACPMGLSPRQVNQMLKAELLRNKVQNPYRGKPAVVNSWRPYRRIPTRRLISRLDLADYESPAELLGGDYLPQRVVLPLKQHAGIPAAPLVSVGEQVKRGQLIAQIPGEGALCSNLFSSISGVVDSVTGQEIRICGAERSKAYEQ